MGPEVMAQLWRRSIGRGGGNAVLDVMTDGFFEHLGERITQRYGLAELAHAHQDKVTIAWSWISARSPA